MDSSSAGVDIVKLAELLKSNGHDSDVDEEEQRVNQPAAFNRTDAMRPKIIRKQEHGDKDDEREQIERALCDGQDNDVSTDWRKCPNWELVYKQSVTPADIYLQMSGKTQLTSSCEDMVITVELPDEEGPGIEVQVTEHHLDVVASRYRLAVPLPHPVDPKLGTAKWHATRAQLVLTLRMAREFDYVNF